MNTKKLDKQIATLGFMTDNGQSTKDTYIRAFSCGSINATMSLSTESAEVILSNGADSTAKIDLFNIKESFRNVSANFDKNDLKKVESLTIRLFNKIKTIIPEPELA